MDFSSSDLGQRGQSLPTVSVSKISHTRPKQNRKHKKVRIYIIYTLGLVHKLHFYFIELTFSIHIKQAERGLGKCYNLYNEQHDFKLTAGNNARLPLPGILFSSARA